MSDFYPFLKSSFPSNRDQPLYRQLYSAVREAILERRLRSGMRLPSTRNFADTLGVSRNTVLTAIEQLIAEGYLESKRGSGTFVAHEIPDEMLVLRSIKNKGSAKAPNLRKTSLRSDLLLSEPTHFEAGKVVSRIFEPCCSAIDEFPMDVWLRCLSKGVRKMPRINLVDGITRGILPLREEVANYLNAHRGLSCDSDQVLIVNGSQHAMDLAAKVLLDNGDRIAIEDPGYPGARGAFAAAGLESFPVSVGKEGLEVVELERSKKVIRAVCTTPSHQFPLGTVMSFSRRLELLEWAERNASWIIEDDYDSEFRYEGKPISSLAGLDSNDRVIYIGTFSKVLFPSLRLGYLVVPADLVSKFEKALAFSTTHSSLFDQLALCEFMKQGRFGSHIRKMRTVYKERQEMLVEAFETDLSEYFSVRRSSGGLHLIGWLKNGLDDKLVAEAIVAAGVYTSPISHYCKSQKLPGGLIFGFSGINKPELKKNLEVLKQVMTTIS